MAGRALATLARRVLESAGAGAALPGSVLESAGAGSTLARRVLRALATGCALATGTAARRRRLYARAVLGSGDRLDERAGLLSAEEATGRGRCRADLRRDELIRVGLRKDHDASLRQRDAAARGAVRVGLTRFDRRRDDTHAAHVDLRRDRDVVGAAGLPLHDGAQAGLALLRNAHDELTLVVRSDGRARDRPGRLAVRHADRAARWVHDDRVVRLRADDDRDRRRRLGRGRGRSRRRAGRDGRREAGRRIDDFAAGGVPDGAVGRLLVGLTVLVHVHGERRAAHRCSRGRRLELVLGVGTQLPTDDVPRVADRLRHLHDDVARRSGLERVDRELGLRLERDRRTVEVREHHVALDSRLHGVAPLDELAVGRITERARAVLHLRAAVEDRERARRGGRLVRRDRRVEAGRDEDECDHCDSEHSHTNRATSRQAELHRGHLFVLVSSSSLGPVHPIAPASMPPMRPEGLVPGWHFGIEVAWGAPSQRVPFMRRRA